MPRRLNKNLSVVFSVMDISESTKIVRSRIEEIVPQHASKIIGYLLHDCGYPHMIRLAFSPDNVIRTNIYKILLWMTSFSMSPTLNNSPFQYRTPYQGFPELTSNNMPLSACSNVLTDQLQRSLKFEGDYLDSALYSTNYSRAPRRSTPNLIQFPPKVCHYFNKGFCKHGNNCKFFHDLESVGNRIGNPNGRDDQLEIDLIELLRSRNGTPISIASLPIAYYKKFHRTLQAEGYLTESQRQGRVGCNLTVLLGRLKSICLVERPDGQHSVILAQDAWKYSNYASDRSENSLRQIYLTFPAESAFNEIDVFDYFNKYGAVHDVRIPSQEKRMFGFVTFVDLDTAQIVLDKKIPHIICGARVLVKPYREKLRLNDRKHVEMPYRAMPYNSHHFDGDSDFHALPRGNNYSRLMRQQFMDQYKSAIDLERTTLSESQLLPKPSARLQYFANSIDELRLAQEFQISNQFDFRLNNVSSSEDNFRIGDTNHSGQESNQVLNLPDNPFSTAMYMS